MLGKPTCFWPALVIAALMSAGCGSESREDIDLAQESVQAALDAWKQGQTADSLKARSSPIEFHDDDWQRGARLVSFQITNAYRDTDGAPRCAVTLTLEQAGGKTETIEITYHVKTTPKVVIARDPYS